MIDRRSWLAGSLLAGGMPLVTSPAPAATGGSLPDDLEIIDCHTHFYDPHRRQGVPWPPPGSSLYRTVLPADLRAVPKFRPLAGTVVIEASAWVGDNRWLLELAEDEPFIVGVIGRIEPGKPAFAGHLERYAANPLFRGIRVQADLVQRLLAEAKLDDLRRLSERGLTLDVNGGPATPRLIARLADQLPDLPIVLNHLGNVALTDDPPPAAWQAGIREAAAHPHVFSKLSALVEGAARDGRQPPRELAFYRPYIDVVWQAFGEDRVIYGSNWPVSERAADYAMLQRIVLEYAATQGTEATRKFCAGNAQRAYHWIDRPGRR